MRIYYFHIDALSTSDKEVLLAMDGFPDSEKERIRRLRLESDQLLSAAGIWLMKHIGISVSELTRTAYNRPLIDQSDLRFNISHSGNIVLLGTVDQGSIGIDIEQKNEVNLSDFQQVMTTEEISTTTTLDAFYRLWTSKEAVIKALGMGFQQDVREIILESTQAQVNGKNWLLYEVEIAQGYHCTVACDEKQQQIELFSLDCKQLVKQQKLTIK